MWDKTVQKLQFQKLKFIVWNEADSPYNMDLKMTLQVQQKSQSLWTELSWLPITFMKELQKLYGVDKTIWHHWTTLFWKYKKEIQM